MLDVKLGIFGDMLDVGCGECIVMEADLIDGSCPEAGLEFVLIDKEGVFFIFIPANAGGRGFDIGGLIGSERPVFGLVGANAPIPSLCFIDIPPPEVGSERDWAWGLGSCEFFLAVVVVVTGDERLSMRGTSADDAENKDVGESARGRVPFTRQLLRVLLRW